MSWCFQAHIFHLSGKDREAEDLFEKSEEILTRREPISPVSFPTISSYYCKFLLETDRAELALQRSLQTLAWRSQGTWQVSVDTTSLLASDLQILGLCYLQLGDKVNAKVYLDKQLDLLQEADEWLYMPSGLNARASYCMAMGDYAAAHADLIKALEISRRTGARFGEWETCLNLSQVHLKWGNRSKAVRYLEELDQVPDMNLYRFRDKELTRLRADLLDNDRVLHLESAPATGLGQRISRG
jgi:tetratricopeptide (TPR) repeat protein